MSDAAREATREQEPVPAAPARSARVPASIGRLGPPIMITLAGVGLWQLILPLAHVPEYLVPTPSEIAADMTTDWPVLEPALLVTAREILLGFVIAVAGGVGLAVLLHLVSVLRRAVYPVLIGSQTIPIVVL